MTRYAGRAGWTSWPAGRVWCSDCGRRHRPSAVPYPVECYPAATRPNATHRDVQPAAPPSTTPTNPRGTTDVTSPADILTECGLPEADAVLLSGDEQTMRKQAGALLDRYRCQVREAAGLDAADAILLSAPTVAGMVAQAERLRSLRHPAPPPRPRKEDDDDVTASIIRDSEAAKTLTEQRRPATTTQGG